VLDSTDRDLLTLLQEDATRSYAALGQAVGLSAGAAHDRVRKLRERGVIRRTTVAVDPAALGRGVLAFVLVQAGSWVGDDSTRARLAALPEIEEAHVIAGRASLLLKVRTASPQDLQETLRRIYRMNGIAGTEAIMVLETFFDRPPDPRPATPAHREDR
jgi:DNA-binding Lrp family transcriptional regulator